ncbi:MAG: ATP-dependent zinc metalloprotease FtsH [candidate division KSB1 bacterium]|nr:ATP-dependent zinc metalloprotease FtsH [candidate division KSB1 bacterium]MDZ7333848.1 ATP-dependent zinc metalloprotease FtsH [candidate division KSB1 bacterium]MDZ7356091.1 ATP-dependent zinc metalloprotease FtsH [candidate division KSB1 bacterium]MDZ7400608.1 ATP-dependent zinc metalloprotease FtsH [candidate division KSB1 bacterium]
MIFWVSQWFKPGGTEDRQADLKQFKEWLETGKISEVMIKGQELQVILKGDDMERQPYQVVLPEQVDINTVFRWIDDYGLRVEAKPRTVEWWGYLLNALPFLILIIFWFVLLRRMQGGGAKGIFSFGKSRARMISENKLRVTFEDVAGADEAKQELKEIIDFLKEPEKFQKLGGKIPKGALLLGPPGTGKTLLAKAVAGEAGVPFFSMSGADFVEMFVGVGASRVRDLFEQGKKNAPCIIFIDELDAVGRHRGAGLGGGHDEREQTLNQLLVEMDGFDSNEGVILLAATNRPDVLDSALLRPGRFDRQIVVDRPDVRGREGILKVHTRKIPLGSDVDISVLAKGTPGFSGADLANMVNEAALLAARKNKKKVDMEDLEEAKDKVLMGTERKSLLISDEEKRSTAYHEAGHAMVAKLTPGSDPVHKVTIIPRGRALGVTTTLPLDEKHNYSKDYCERMLIHLLGGRAAEKIVLNQLTTGAGNDIERATEIARKMVCEWGMSERLGPMTFGKKQEEIFLGREIAQHRDYSEKTAQLIDQEVRAIVEKAANTAEKLIQENLDKLHALAKALLEREMLDGNEIDAILNQVDEERKKQTRNKSQAKLAVNGSSLAKAPEPKRRTRKKSSAAQKPEAEKELV